MRDNMKGLDTFAVGYAAGKAENRKIDTGDIVEMAICEVPYLILRANVLYRFVVIEGCQACADAVSPYKIAT